MSDNVSGPSGQGWGEQETVPIESVDVDSIAALSDLGKIVGEGGAHVGADLDDLGLRKRGMQGIGTLQEFDHGAGTDALALVALDHGRSHHE